MAGQGESSRPSLWRVAWVSLAAVAAVLWAWSGWTWWVLVPLIVGLVVARLVIGLFPMEWRDWASGLAGTVIAGLVAVWLLSFTPFVALGVAVGVGGVVCAAQLRTVLPRWAGWTTAGVSAALALGCALAAWLTWLDVQERREADERAEQEYRHAELRPDKPLAVLHQVVKAIHDNDSTLVCALFTKEAERQFAAEAGTDTCPTAISALHEQITGKGYGNATAEPDDVNLEEPGKPASVSGCDMYVVDGPLEYTEPPGPALGTFRLVRDPKYPNSGYLITHYIPCGEEYPAAPSSVTPPPVLPSYPPSFPGLLAQAIAARNEDVCKYFTPSGAAQLATMVGTRDCPAAIETLSHQVTDPAAYANPDGVTMTRNGTTVIVHACALMWNNYGNGNIIAGPQLGHLILSRPETHTTGFLIDEVMPC